MNKKLKTKVQLRLPTFYIKRSENLPKDLRIVFHANPFFIFCKNFEILLAKSWKFEVLSTDELDEFLDDFRYDNECSALDFCAQITSEILAYGYSAEEVLDYLENSIAVKVDRDFSRESESETQQQISMIAKILRGLTQLQFNKVLIKFSPILKECNDDKILLLSILINEFLVHFADKNICSYFTLYNFMLENYVLITPIITDIELLTKDILGKDVDCSGTELKNIDCYKWFCINTIYYKHHFSTASYIESPNPEKASSNPFSLDNILNLGTELPDEEYLKLFFLNMTENRECSVEKWEKSLLALYSFKNVFPIERNYGVLVGFTLDRTCTSKGLCELYLAEQYLIHVLFSQDCNFEGKETLKLLLDKYLQNNYLKTKDALDFEQGYKALQKMDFF